MVVDRPLNACIEHQLVRLAEALVPEGEDDLDERLTQVAGLEAEYRRVVAPSRAPTPATPPSSSSGGTLLGAKTGAVTAVQRTSSDLRLNPLLAVIDTANVSR